MTLTRQPICLKKYCLAAITGSFLHSRFISLLAYLSGSVEDQKNYRRQTMNIPIIVRRPEQLREYFSVEPLRSNDGETESISHSVVSDSLQSHGLKPTRLHYPWNSPGKNTGVGSHSLLHRISLTQGFSLGLLYCRQILCRLSQSLNNYIQNGFFL